VRANARPTATGCADGLLLIPIQSDNLEQMEPSVGATLRPPGPPAELERIDVTIVMPCLNEELSLPHCMKIAREALDMLAERGFTGEIVVADNGSTDGSRAIVESSGGRVVDCPVRGYGNALQWGIAGARGRFVIMGDADGSYDFREGVPMIERLADGYELCMGSRFAGEIRPGAMPWKNRYIGNPVLTGILNMFFRSGLTDAHCGLRAFTREAYLKVNPTSPGMEFASEMIIKAALLDLRRTELPITLHPDLRDRPPHLRPWQDGWRHLRFLVMLSPLWLYFLPAVLLVALGVGILGVLLATPPGEVARLGRFWIGEHWATIGTAMVLCGHQAAMLGLAATLVGVRERYRKVTPGLGHLFRASRLDRLLISGAVVCVLGFSVLLYVVVIWAGNDFGPLAMTREMLVGTTLVILGVQTIMGGFLLSVIAGNDAELDVVVRREKAFAALSGGGAVRGSSDAASR
jgi:hypothetical protein